MTKQEIQEFIERLEEVGDVWEEEDVERCYGEDSLEDALEDRFSQLNTMADIIGTILNR